MLKESCNIDLNQILNHLTSGVVVHEMDTTIVYANNKALNLLRLTWEQAIGLQALHSDWRILNEFGEILEYTAYPVNRVINNNEQIEDEIFGIIDQSNEKTTWLQLSANRFSVDEKEFVIVSFVDISYMKEIPFKQIVDKATDAVVVTKADLLDEPHGPKIVYTNQAFTDITGYGAEEVKGKTPRILQGEDTDREALDRIKTALKKHESSRETILNYDKNGNSYWLDIAIFPLYDQGSNKLTHFAAIERDVSQYKSLEKEFINAANTDPLTNLVNRRGFENFTKHMPKESNYSLVMFDIDLFKQVNDTYGHDCGDKVLKEFAKVLQSYSRSNDICARFGGEEFVMLLSDVSLAKAGKIAERIRLAVEKIRIETQEGSIKFSVSAGCSDSSQADGLYEVIKAADTLLYKAKENGRNCVIAHT